MALQLANVALSDTFNTWRVRTNQVLEQAVSGTSTTAQSITANVALSGRLTGDAAAFTGLVTAPRFNANNLGGTLTTAAQGNITRPLQGHDRRRRFRRGHGLLHRLHHGRQPQQQRRLLGLRPHHLAGRPQVPHGLGLHLRQDVRRHEVPE